MINICSARYNSTIMPSMGRNKSNLQKNNAEKKPDIYNLPVKGMVIQFPVSQIIKQEINLEKTRPNMLSHTKINYKEWLKQFETDKEKSLALKMLQNFMYIDLDNARSAYKKLYADLAKEIDINKTNFAILGTAKSGSVMGYLFRQANKLRSKGKVQHEYSNIEYLPSGEKFLNYTQIADVEFNKNQVSNGKENFVIVDDILGDGDSFTEYLTPEVIDSLSLYKNIYLVTLVKDPDGEKRIKTAFPQLNIKFMSAQEIHKYDSPENKAFTDYEKAEIHKLLEKYGKKICPELVNKYKRSKLLTAFDWNTPGNAPMIFNITNSKWKGLFQRYNGLEEQNVSPKYNFYN